MSTQRQQVPHLLALRARFGNHCLARLRDVFLVILLVVAASPRSHAADFDPAPIDALVQDALKAWRVPGVAVAIVRDGEVVYLKGHGVRDVNTREPVTPDTLFPIASCTKAFTTAAMAVLVDEGMMAWDDPVSKHLPYFHLSDPLADKEVILRDLVCHRSGLRGHELLWYRSPWTLEEQVRKLALLPLDKPFRSTFQYQSTMFVAAGLAVAHTAKMPWEDFVKKRLLDPLGMTATVFTTTAAARSSDRATGHRLNHEGRPEVIPIYPMEVPHPAGSIQSNARDLAKWVRFQLGDGTFHGQRIVSKRNLDETHTPQMVIRLEGLEREIHCETNQMSYGMGWVIQDYRGQGLVSHGGAIEGFRTHLTLVPRSRLGLVLICNVTDSRMNQALVNTLLDHLLGLSKKDWNGLYADLLKKEQQASDERGRVWLASRHPNTRPSRELAAYSGNFEHPAYGTIHVSLDHGVLRWRWNHFEGLLAHFHYDTFVLPIEKLGNPEIVFSLGADGAVSQMEVRGRVGVEFRRVK
jgi:CubicO group peptidase (beta-lactamase class C family)